MTRKEAIELVDKIIDSATNEELLRISRLMRDRLYELSELEQGDEIAHPAGNLYQAAQHCGQSAMHCDEAQSLINLAIHQTEEVIGRIS